MNCTRCEGTGFLNLDQIEEKDMAAINAAPDFHDAVLAWIVKRNKLLAELGGCSCHLSPPCSYCTSQHDVAVCDCCGNGKTWHGTPGEHYDWVSNSNRGGSEPFPECY